MMKRFPHAERFFITEDLLAFSDAKVKDGTFETRVELLLLGYAYAVANGLKPYDKGTKHSLGGGVQPVTIDPKIRQAMEASLERYCAKSQISAPKDEKAA